jgi:hypothetical protein
MFFGREGVEPKIKIDSGIVQLSNLMGLPTSSKLRFFD